MKRCRKIPDEGGITDAGERILILSPLAVLFEVHWRLGEVIIIEAWEFMLSLGLLISAVAPPPHQLMRNAKLIDKSCGHHEIDKVLNRLRAVIPTGHRGQQSPRLRPRGAYCRYVNERQRRLRGTRISFRRRRGERRPPAESDCCSHPARCRSACSPSKDNDAAREKRAAGWCCHEVLVVMVMQPPAELLRSSPPIRQFEDRTIANRSCGPFLPP